jgi:uncharacterized protein (TIGR00255 family)
MLSMTGYGTAAADAPGVRIVVEVRGVNQRHLDVRVTGAREYLPWEAEVRERVKDVAQRGRVDVQIVRLADPGSRRHRVAVREDLAQAYVGAARRLGRQLGVDATLPMGEVLRLPGLCEVIEEPPDPRRELPALRRALGEALQAFAVQRRREGRHLARDMRARVAAVAQVARELRRGLPEARAVVRRRLEERVARLAAGVEVEPARLAHEVATIVERGDVTEEVVRLDGHVAALRVALREEGPVGKRIEFLLQEVQRELNTTGSKAATPALAALALRGTEEVEKLREQVQNVE